MINITGQSSAEEVVAQLTKLQRRQIPFATALALTAIARRTQAAVVRQMQNTFDRPTRWTLGGTYVLPAKRKEFPIEAKFWFRDFAPKGSPATKYLGQHVYGGKRNTKRSELALQAKGIMPRGSSWVPAARAKTDAYGNISGPRITKMLSQLKASNDPMQNITGRSAKRANNRGMTYYVVTNKAGQALGINIRRGKRVERFMVFTKGQPYYRVRLPLFKIAENVTKARYTEELVKALDHAIAMAR